RPRVRSSTVTPMRFVRVVGDHVIRFVSAGGEGGAALAQGYSALTAGGWVDARAAFERALAEQESPHAPFGLAMVFWLCELQNSPPSVAFLGTPSLPRGSLRTAGSPG